MKKERKPKVKAEALPLPKRVVVAQARLLAAKRLLLDWMQTASRDGSTPETRAQRAAAKAAYREAVRDARRIIAEA